MSLDKINSEPFRRQRQELSYIKLNELRKDTALCDVTLKTEIDGEEIHAHRCVIASNSEYFEKMFVGGFKESNQKLIIIEGIDHTTLRHLIDFMYSGKLVAIDAENVEGILNGAELFQLNDIRDICIEYLTKTINDENCLVIKDIADSRVKVDLSKKCLKYALKRFESVSHGPAFLNANIEQITELIENYDSKCSGKEENTYEAVINWVRYDESDRKRFLPQLLGLLRLASISHDFLHRKIITDPLIKANPKCTELIKKTYGYFNFRYGNDTLPLPSTESKSQKNPIPRADLPQVQCKNPDSPCFGMDAIDLSVMLNGSVTDFQKSEWTVLMNEDNFLKDWEDEWEDVHGPWIEAD